ncbi:MAG: hypothetical protein PHH84_01825 [Oscillospiraceae bacterium]|nr:hypothetical protein [Oscillospiraceae bacterium]MDD4413465.1 hypothetical protein [Oscillospiraceae bacterium]
MRKKETVYILKLDSAERGVLIAALNELRNKRIEEGKSIEFVNEVFAKLIEN